MAKRVPKGCKVTVSAGIGDYTCPPTGVAAFYNNLACENKKITWTQGATHGYMPPVREKYER